MKKVLIIFIVVVLFFGIAMYRDVDIVYGLFHPYRYDGPYKGRIIDAESKQPIEGVVVLGTWSRIHTNIAGANHSFYDARESVTDKNGDFEIRGMGVMLFSNIEPMDVLIFKSGYEHKGVFGWTSLKEDLGLRDTVKWEVNKAIVLIKKLPMEERNKRRIPDYIPSEASSEKIILMLKEINKEREDRGFKRIDIWKGEKI